MISFNIKHLGWKGMACGAIVAAASLTACSDWDDHFDANTSVLDSQNATLWQNIERNASLTQFAELLRKTGYDQRLDASQTYTVWAPEDNTFDYQTVLGYASDRMVKEFVENHIARNNYPVSGEIDKNVYMLNEKKMHFSGRSSYDIQGMLLNQLNLSSSNGTLHTIKGRVPFLSSIYESLNSFDYPLDSISDYIHSFDEKKIDETKSKQGPVLNGEQTYLDTVYYEHNDMLMLFDAFINREDSSYTMLMPTNKAWEDAVNKIRQYCNYLPSFEYMENVDDKKIEKVTLKDAEAMKDSVTKVYMMASLFYNNNLYDNKNLKTLAEGATLNCDSLMTTYGFKMYSEDAAKVFTDAKREEKSNGVIWVTDSLRIPSWVIWNPEIRIEAEYSSLWAGYNYVNGTPSVKEVVQQNDEVYGRVSNDYYLEVEPQSRSVNPEMDFYMPSVRSAEYSIYAVFVPGNINSKYYSGELKPNLLDFTIGYADKTGANKEEVFKNITTHVDSLKTGEGYTAMVDTVYVGDFTFPVSYLGMYSGSKSYAPYIRVRSRVSNRETANYDRTLRIDCIILRPKELDDYLKAHPDYVYDKGLY